MGLALLLAYAFLFACAAYLVGIVLESLHPPRRTIAWALSRGYLPAVEDLRRPFRTWHVETRDGVRLPVWELQGDRPDMGFDVVILHGWGRSRWDSLRRVDQFAPCAARLILPELRGHGESPRGITHLGCGEETDLLRVLESLAPSDRPILLVGHSMGANIVIRAAADAAASAGTPRIAGVIALAPYERLRTPILARMRLRGYPTHPFGPLAVGFLPLLGLREEPTSRSAARLPTPLLVVSAKDDVISPAAEGAAIAAAAPQGRHVVLPGHDHADPHASAAAEWAEALAAFIASLPPAAYGSPAGRSR